MAGMRTKLQFNEVAPRPSMLAAMAVLAFKKDMNSTMPLRNSTVTAVPIKITVTIASCKNMVGPLDLGVYPM